MFLAVVFDEQIRYNPAQSFRLLVESSVARWEEKENLHVQDDACTGAPCL